MATERHLGDLDHGAHVVRCVFSPDGKRLATIGLEDTKYWDLASGTVGFSYGQSDVDKDDDARGFFPRHTGGTFMATSFAVAMSTRLTDEYYAPRQPFHCLTLRDAKTGEHVMSFNHLIGSAVTCTFSPKCDWVAIPLVGTDGGPSFLLSPVSNFMEIGRILVYGANATAFAPDGSNFLMATQDTVYLADLEKLLFALADHFNNPDDDYPHIDFNYDEFSMGMRDAVVTLRNDDNQPSSKVTHCSFSPDSKHVLTVRGGSRLDLYDANTATQMTTMNLNIDSSTISACHRVI